LTARDRHAERPPDRRPAAGSILVEARGVSFGYGRGPVLTDVDLVVRAGEFVALVGPNGSGKSTLLRVLLGAARPSVGTVRLLGEPPEQLRDRGRIGFVPQRPVLDSAVPATVEEIVAAGRLARRGWWRPLRAADRDEVRHALGAVGLTELARRPLNELSGGQQQRVFIARAFASGPQLLLLDEPIAGVDAESQRRFRDSLTHLITEHGAGVLLVSHELSAVAAELDRVVVLKGSVLFDGPPSELAASGVSLGVHRDDLPLWLEGLR
jgi:zinc transport system ATP-binding protein